MARAGLGFIGEEGGGALEPLPRDQVKECEEWSEETIAWIVSNESGRSNRGLKVCLGRFVSIIPISFSEEGLNELVEG